MGWPQGPGPLTAWRFRATCPRTQVAEEIGLENREVRQLARGFESFRGRFMWLVV